VWGHEQPSNYEGEEVERSIKLGTHWLIGRPVRRPTELNSSQRRGAVGVQSMWRSGTSLLAPAGFSSGHNRTGGVEWSSSLKRIISGLFD